MVKWGRDQAFESTQSGARRLNIRRCHRYVDFVTSVETLASVLTIVVDGKAAVRINRARCDYGRDSG